MRGRRSGGRAGGETGARNPASPPGRFPLSQASGGSYQPHGGALRKRADERQRAVEKRSRCRASGGDPALRGESPRRRYDGGDAGGRMGGHSGVPLNRGRGRRGIGQCLRGESNDRRGRQEARQTARAGSPYEPRSRTALFQTPALVRECGSSNCKINTSNVPGTVPKWWAIARHP